MNPNIEKELYPTPNNDEMFLKMQGGSTFSKIDLKQAYLQIEMDEKAKTLLVINTSKGLKQYQKMPFGITPASAIFQVTIENALRNIPRVGVRDDDIIISGHSNLEHLENLRTVLDVIHNLGLTANRNNCKFLLDELENLGHIIDKNDIRVNMSKVDAIKNISVPTTVKDLRSFIGCVNYYSKFIPNMGIICKPPYTLLEKETRWYWDQKQQNAFDSLKLQLSSAPILAIYDKNLPLKLDCDD